jgi:hypothetical protein
VAEGWRDFVKVAGGCLMAEYHEAPIPHLQSPDGVKPEVRENQFPLKKCLRAQGELGVSPRVPTLGKMKISQPRMTRIFTDKRGWIWDFLTSVGILRRWQPLSRRFTRSSSVIILDNPCQLWLKYLILDNLSLV